MTFTVEESVLIDRSREDVWAHVMERNDWRRPEVLQVRQLTQGPPGVGTEYEDTVRLMGREIRVVNEVERFEPPATISWKEVDGPGPVHAVEGSYRLEAVNGKTRFTLSSEYQARGLWRLLVPLIRRQLQGDLYPRYLQQLKEAIESEE